MDEAQYIAALADLVVRFGANVQPGQIVAISSEPGKEALTRAIAEVAYAAGALFVDLSVFDVRRKRSSACGSRWATFAGSTRRIPSRRGRPGSIGCWRSRVDSMRCAWTRCGLTAPVPS